MKTLVTILVYAALLFTVSIAFTANTGGGVHSNTQASPPPPSDSAKVVQTMPHAIIQLARTTKQLYLHDTLFEYEKHHNPPYEPTQHPAHTQAVKAY